MKIKELHNREDFGKIFRLKFKDGRIVDCIFYFNYKNEGIDEMWFFKDEPTIIKIPSSEISDMIVEVFEIINTENLKKETLKEKTSVYDKAVEILKSQVKYHIEKYYTNPSKVDYANDVEQISNQCEVTIASLTSSNSIWLFEGELIENDKVYSIAGNAIIGWYNNPGIQEEPMWENLPEIKHLLITYKQLTDLL